MGLSTSAGYLLLFRCATTGLWEAILLGQTSFFVVEDKNPLSVRRRLRLAETLDLDCLGMDSGAHCVHVCHLFDTLNVHFWLQMMAVSDVILPVLKHSIVRLCQCFPDLRQPCRLGFLSLSFRWVLLLGQTT